MKRILLIAGSAFALNGALVHGAFAESSSWNGVIAALLDDGHPVIAVANPLRGVAFDADYLRGVLAGIDGDVICVGHSYGGIVITNGAAGNGNVKALVYIGAFAPDRGESAADLANRYEGSTLGETLAPVKLPDGARPTNTRRVVVADGPQTAEAEPNDTPDQAGKVASPGGVSGVIGREGDADLFRFDAK